MKNLFKFILITFLISAILTACGPSQAEVDATYTQAAADIFATQTALAPTITPTFTPSPTATITPTPTPTNTPTPTPTKTPTPTRSVQPGLISFEIVGEFFVINTDGQGDAIKIYSDIFYPVFPIWSPDGKKIAFASGRDSTDLNAFNYEIYTINFDGTGLQRLTNNAAGDVWPAWSPDSQQIAFSSDRDGNNEIYIMNADGSGVKRLTQNPATDSGPAWSPDGQQIAFFSTRDSNKSEIYVMNIDGSGITRLTNNSTEDAQVTWSPDGKKLAFTSVNNGNNDIYVINRDGSGLTNLTNNGDANQMPAWSPDGQLIAFQSTQRGRRDIYVMNANGSDVWQLTDDENEERWPSWSPPGVELSDEPWFGVPNCIRDADGDFQADTPATAFSTDDSAYFIAFPYRNMKDGMMWSHYWKPENGLSFIIMGPWDGGESGYYIAMSTTTAQAGDLVIELSIEDNLVQVIHCPVVKP